MPHGALYTFTVLIFHSLTPPVCTKHLKTSGPAGARVSEKCRMCLLPVGVTLGSKKPVNHSACKREQRLLWGLHGETGVLPAGESGGFVDGERGFQWREGISSQRWDSAGVRGGKTVLHLETERQAVGAGAWDPRMPRPCPVQPLSDLRP